MYSYNRIHNDHDTNVVRVELNSSYRPRSAARGTSREPKLTSSVNRSDTFTKHERPSTGIIRSETFVVKHHEESSDEKPDYSTYTRSKRRDNGENFERDDKSNYGTYTRRTSTDKRGSRDEKSLYINTDTYRKDKKRASLLSQESENLNANTFTKSAKPKRVESFIRKIEKNLWRRKDNKEPSPAPSSHSTDKSDHSTTTAKRSKNIFNLISGGKKSTREVEIQCKMDEEKDYYEGIATRKSSIQSLSSEQKKYRPLKTSQRYENGSNQRLTSIIKSTDRNRTKHRDPYYEYENNAKKSSTPAPIRVEIDLRNSSKYVESNRKPVGIASPLPQTRALKSAVAKNYDRKGDTVTRSYAPTTRIQVGEKTSNNFQRDGDQMSFREYREKLRMKHEHRKITDNSDDDLRRSYQQSFFIPM